MRILRARRGLGGSRRAEVPLAVRLLDPALDPGVGIGRDPGRVRAHVGDQPCGTFGSELDSLIQLLGHAHGGKRAHPQAAGRVLLHGRRDVWRVRALGAALLLDADDAVARAFELADDLLRLGLVVDLELRVFLSRGRACGPVEPRQEVVLGALLGQLRVDRPRLDRDELPDLVLSIDHQSQRDGRHASGADSLLDLAPQERAQAEADQPIDHAPRLLGVDQAHVDLTRRFQRAAHCVRGDLVELDPLWIAQLQHLGEMPRDGLSLPVGVGGEDDLALALGG